MSYTHGAIEKSSLQRSRTGVLACNHFGFLRVVDHPITNLYPLYARHLPLVGAVEEDGSALGYGADQAKDITHDRRVA